MLALVFAFAMSSCTFIVQPPDEIPGASIVLPLTCLPVVVNPLTGTNEVVSPGTVKRVQVIFTMRIERSMATLASTIDRFVTEVVAGLSALSVHVETAAILRLDERPVSPFVAAYGCGLEDPEDLPVVDILTHYASAAEPPDQPVGCAVDPLLQAGVRIDGLSTSYPPGFQARSGVSVFGPPPDYLLVVHLDPLERRTASDEPGCAGRNFRGVREDGSLAWINFSGTPDLPPSAVEHWFIYSDEGVTQATFQSRCQETEGFDLSFLDALEASARPLYSALSADTRAGGGPVQVLSMCALLAEGPRIDFLQRSLGEMARRLGTRLNLEILDALLRGELPGVAEPPEDAGT